MQKKKYSKPSIERLSSEQFLAKFFNSGDIPLQSELPAEPPKLNRDVSEKQRGIVPAKPHPWNYGG
jgi:hypothetical protein